MSTDKKKTGKDAAPAADAAVAKPAGKGRLILIIGVVLLLAAGGDGGGWYYMRSATAKAGVAAEEPAQKKAGAPVFVNLETFTINLADRERYLQLGVTYEVEGSEVTDAMKVHMPILRSRILLLLAAKTAEQLGSSEGKTELATALVEEARKVLPGKGPKDEGKGVDAVHFSAFVIQ